MRLCIVGCILFSLAYIEVSAKIKTTNHGTKIRNSEPKKTNLLYKLPYDGGILNSKGEYVPGSLPEVWDPILEQIAKHSDSKGREVLLRCKLQYDKLNTALLNNDSSSFVRIFSKYVTLTDQIIPLYHNVEYAKACDVIGNRNGIIMLNQELCSANESNSTFLQKTNDFLKSVANNLYHASLKYQPTPTGKC